MSNETEDQIVQFGHPRNDGKYQNKSYLEARESAANYTDPRKIKRDQRRAKVMELRRNKGMTFEEISEYIKSQGTRFLKEGQHYGEDVVLKDLRDCLRTMTDETRELAKEYLPEELADLEAKQDDVNEMLSLVKELLTNTSPSMENIDDYDKASRTYGRFFDALEKIRDRRSKYLPLETAKEVNVRSQNMYGSVEDFLELKRQQKEQEESEETVEGEFEVSEEA